MKDLNNSKLILSDRAVDRFSILGVLLIIDCLLMSVRLWNFKHGGVYNARFLPKNQHAKRNFVKKNATMNAGLSKSAAIVLSGSIFYVKN